MDGSADVGFAFNNTPKKRILIMHRSGSHKHKHNNYVNIDHIYLYDDHLYSLWIFRTMPGSHIEYLEYIDCLDDDDDFVPSWLVLGL